VKEISAGWYGVPSVTGGSAERLGLAEELADWLFCLLQ